MAKMENARLTTAVALLRRETGSGRSPFCDRCPGALSVAFGLRGAVALSEGCRSLTDGSGGTSMVIQSPPGWGWDRFGSRCTKSAPPNPKNIGTKEPPRMRRLRSSHRPRRVCGMRSRAARRLRGKPHRRRFPLYHLSGDRPGSGPARVGPRIAAAAFPVRLGLRAGRTVRRRRAERNQPATRAGRRVRWVDAFGVYRAPSIGSIIVARPDADRAVLCSGWWWQQIIYVVHTRSDDRRSRFRSFSPVMCSPRVPAGR